MKRATFMLGRRALKKFIEVVGARQNNLQNVNVKIPRDELTVITGVSGSGKSSLAFDVIFGEGHRRFLQSLSTYARTRLPQVKKPDVDFISGLSPVVAIEQKQGIRNPRSTVGTLTDIVGYLRLLFSVAGKAHCPYCEREISVQTSSQIAERIQSLPEGTAVEIRALLYKIYGESYQYLLNQIRDQGYRTFRINGELLDVGDEIKLGENENYRIEAVIDKIVVRKGIYKQLLDILENGMVIGQKFLRIEILDPERPGREIADFYSGFACSQHHFVCGELLPRHFSPNDPGSACHTCGGLGTYMRAMPFLLIKDEEKSIKEGALETFNVSQRTYKKFNNPNALLLYSLAEHYGFNPDVPFKELPQNVKDIIFHGTKREKFELILPEGSPIEDDPRAGKRASFEGLVSRINRWHKRTTKSRTPKTYEERMMRRVMAEQTCPDCNGVKLRKHQRLIRINGKTIHECGELPLEDLLTFLKELKLPREKKEAGETILKELISRLTIMIDIGLDYLNLNRRTDTLSGGEIQRTALATQIGSELIGMLYVLDEPSIGLHQKDNHKLITMMKNLRDLGNTIIVIEHDLETIKAADHIIELGPGPGIHGGNVVAQGTLEAIKNHPLCQTGHYLSGQKTIKIPTNRREPNGHFLEIIGACENNLKNINVKIPLGVFICITGVSGSGKSSLANDILYKKLYAIFRDRRIIPGKHEAIKGTENLSDVRNIDQSPIGRSSRSNPATYVGFFDSIRGIFSDLPEAKARGFTYSDFSFNTKSGGRCPQCRGEGTMTTVLQYMPDIESVCPECKGTRFTEEILEIKYRGKNIADILEMTIEEALAFFKDKNMLLHKLRVLNDLGLGYMKLGQSSTTISGGEAQRLKLGRELAKIKRRKDNLYILDEPTTGLHLADIQRLLDILHKLVKEGNTVLVIEHHLDVIKTADYVIDLGPDGGKGGGRIVAQGMPEEVAQCSESYTGKYLSEMFDHGCA
jgi:excinuclease ABC subunit A